MSEYLMVSESSQPEEGVTRSARFDAAELGSETLLVIDTSLGTSLALGTREGIFTLASDDPRGHAEVVGSMLGELLAAAGVSPAQVSGVVMGVGPGPFTGLRVGMAAARAFAFGAGARLLPVQAHAAVALTELGGAAAGVRVVQDARRRELFVTGFSGLDWAGVPVCSEPSRVVPRAGFAEQPGDVWPARVPADAMLVLASRMLRGGAQFASGEAVYLRQPDVKEPTGPKRVTP